MQWFSLVAQEERIRSVTDMKYDGANIQDDGVRLLRARPLMFLAQGYPPVPKLPPAHFGTGDGSEENANVPPGHVSTAQAL